MKCKWIGQVNDKANIVTLDFLKQIPLYAVYRRHHLGSEIHVDFKDNDYIHEDKTI